jgi:hypothetical protein
MWERELGHGKLHQEAHNHELVDAPDQGGKAKRESIPLVFLLGSQNQHGQPPETPDGDPQKRRLLSSSP